MAEGGSMTECPKCGYNIQPGDVECSHCGTDVAYIKEKLAKKEAEVAEKQTQKERISERLFELIEKMTESQLESLLAAAEELLGKKKRVHERFTCLITADCVYHHRAYNNYVKDISVGGVFMETREPFSQGEAILLTLSMAHYSKPFKITGEIVRLTPEGVGVKFKTMSQVQEELIQNLVKQVEKFKK